MRGTSRFVFVLAAFAATLSADALQDGVMAFHEGRYSTAIALLREAVKISSDERARVFLALAQAATNDCKSALPVLTTALRSNTGELGRLAGLSTAKCQSSMGDTAGALQTLGTLNARFAKDADILYLSAEIEMTAFNNTTFAMFQQTPSSYRTHELSAEILEIQERFADAASEYKKAIALNPSAPDLHFRMGRAILLRGHDPDALTEAASAFAAELKISPEDSACYYQLAQIAQVKGDPAAARTQYEKALQLSPGFVSSLVALGKLDLQQNDAARAIPLLRKATDLEPDNETAHYALLNAYRNTGDMDRARKEKAILDRLQKPSDTEFSDFLKKLDSKAPAQ